MLNRVEHSGVVDYSHDYLYCDRETSLILHIALKVHILLLKKILVDAVFDLAMRSSQLFFVIDY